MTEHTGPAKVHALFATNIIETTLPDAEAVNKDLIALITQRMKMDKGRLRSNIHGWQSGEDIIEWGGEAIKKLAIHTLETCSHYTDDTGMIDEKPRFAWNIQMWANVCPPGASNQYHTHPGAYWSAVYYVDDGGDAKGGPLILQDPRFPLNKMVQPDMTFNNPAANNGPEKTLFTISPNPGRLIAFPSWLTHGVKAHHGHRPRISIAMNLIAVPVPADA